MKAVESREGGLQGVICGEEDSIGLKCYVYNVISVFQTLRTILRN